MDQEKQSTPSQPIKIIPFEDYKQVVKSDASNKHWFHSHSKLLVVKYIVY